MIEPRKLAAIDLLFLGPKLIVAEFAVGALGSGALGVFTLLRSRSFGGILFGAYLIALGINYIPLLVFATLIATRRAAAEELATELGDKSAAMRKYRRQSLWLLVPFSAVIGSLSARRGS